MRPRALRRRLALAGFGAMLAAATITTGVAKADGVLSPSEAVYIDTFAPTKICPALDVSPTEYIVNTILARIMNDGFSPDNAADILNWSVALYCPRWGDLLQQIGDKARGASGSFVA